MIVRASTYAFAITSLTQRHKTTPSSASSHSTIVTNILKGNRVATGATELVKFHGKLTPEELQHDL